MRLPSELTEIIFGSSLKDRRSIIRRRPDSVPANRAAPSVVNVSEVNGVLRSVDLKCLFNC